MSQRRSLSSVMEITPEKLAFIKGAGQETAQAVDAKSAGTALPTKAALPPPVAEDAGGEDSRGEEAEEAPSAARSRRGTRHRAPQSDVSLAWVEHLRVPITARVHPRTAEALRRAHLEQKLRRQAPGTQQEIIEAALQGWLRENGYAL